MKRLITVLLVTVGLAFPAHADGPYVSAFGGVNFQDDIDGDVIIPGFATGPFTVETETGFVVGGAVGYKWNFTDWSLSVEGEGSFRNNDVDTVGPPSVPASGDVQIAGIMANVIFAYETPTSTFLPYIGGGVGVGIVHADITSFGVTAVDDTSTGFAYQFMAGVGYKITPMLIVGVEYRLFGVTGTEFDADSSIAAILALPPGTKADVDNILNHAVMVKLTYAF